jgi:hypothetical protein
MKSYNPNGTAYGEKVGRVLAEINSKRVFKKALSNREDSDCHIKDTTKEAPNPVIIINLEIVLLAYSRSSVLLGFIFKF